MRQAQRIELLTARESSFLRVYRHRPDDGSWSNTEIGEVTNDDCRHEEEHDSPAAALEHRRKQHDREKFAERGASEREAGAEVRLLLPREKRQCDKPDGDGVYVSAAGKLPNDERVP